jgi:hypothetical protein
MFQSINLLELIFGAHGVISRLNYVGTDCEMRWVHPLISHNTATSEGGQPTAHPTHCIAMFDTVLHVHSPQLFEDPDLYVK